MDMRDQSQRVVKNNGLRAAILVVGGILVLGLAAMLIYANGRDDAPLLEPEADKTIETPADRAP